MNAVSDACRLVVPILGLLIAAIAASSPVSAQTGPPQSWATELSPARRAEIAARIYANVKLYFAHWDDVPQLDFDAAFTAYLEEAMAAPDRAGFSLASEAFVAQLGNGHTRFSDRALYQDAAFGHRFATRRLDGRWIVTVSRRDDLRVGDEIVTFDGRPMDAVADSIGARYSSSTDRYRAYQLFWRSHRYLFPLRYELGLADGRTVVVDRSVADEPRDPEFEARLLDGGVAYIRVPSWNDPSFEKRALAALDSFVTAPGLVVDVRGNGGGNTPSAFISALMDRPWRWWAESTPMRIALFAAGAEAGYGSSDFRRPHMAWPSETSPGEGRYRGPIAILVDEGCHSACEDFVQPFRDNDRATLVGSTTAGSTGQPWFGDLGDGMFLSVGTKREVFPDGRRFEGVGVEPHVFVRLTAQELKAGRDVELETALDILRR